MKCDRLAALIKDCRQTHLPACELNLAGLFVHQQSSRSATGLNDSGDVIASHIFKRSDVVAFFHLGLIVFLLLLLLIRPYAAPLSVPINCPP